ncbi:Hypothetical predicted protein [Octopus vulgaris]|uniref:Uncharacterized protein n=1 Tax=Octopus vulgaris TaxID=6645 RepID=A0AA36FF07_OCTVU|nr:Hypothetical predicted protein [Octopus vulgaris]
MPLHVCRELQITGYPKRNKVVTISNEDVVLPVVVPTMATILNRILMVEAFRMMVMISGVRGDGLRDIDDNNNLDRSSGGNVVVAVVGGGSGSL